MTTVLSSTATSFTASVRSNSASLARSSKRPSVVSHRAVRAPVSCPSSTHRDGADQAAVPSELVGRRAALSAALISSLALDLSVMPAVAASLSGPTDGPVLVVGATGNTGRRVVAQLRAKGVAVRAGSRDTKKASSLGLAAAGAELVQIDVLDKASIEAAMQGCTAVICATGFTPSLNFKKDNPAKVDHEGTDNLVAVATATRLSVPSWSTLAGLSFLKFNDGVNPVAHMTAVHPCMAASMLALSRTSIWTSSAPAAARPSEEAFLVSRDPARTATPLARS